MGPCCSFLAVIRYFTSSCSSSHSQININILLLSSQYPTPWLCTEETDAVKKLSESPTQTSPHLPESFLSKWWTALILIQGWSVPGDLYPLLLDYGQWAIDAAILSPLTPPFSFPSGSFPSSKLLWFLTMKEKRPSLVSTFYHSSRHSSLQKNDLKFLLLVFNYSPPIPSQTWSHLRSLSWLSSFFSGYIFSVPTGGLLFSPWLINAGRPQSSAPGAAFSSLLFKVSWLWSKGLCRRFPQWHLQTGPRP